MKLTAEQRLKKISKLYEDEWQEYNGLSKSIFWMNDNLRYDLMGVYCDLQHRGCEDKTLMKTLMRCMKRLSRMEKYMDRSHLNRRPRK